MTAYLGHDLSCVYKNSMQTNAGSQIRLFFIWHYPRDLQWTDTYSKLWAHYDKCKERDGGPEKLHFREWRKAQRDLGSWWAAVWTKYWGSSCRQQRECSFFSLISGHAIVPKYYYVPADFVEAEQSKHGSQKRFPSNSGRDGKIFLWGQALYNLAKLLGMFWLRCVYGWCTSLLQSTPFTLIGQKVSTSSHLMTVCFVKL